MNRLAMKLRTLATALSIVAVTVACDGGSPNTPQPSPTLGEQTNINPDAVARPSRPIGEPMQGASSTPGITGPAGKPTAASGIAIDGPLVPVKKSAKFGDLLVTVNGMRRWIGDSTNRPQEGNEYLILDITVANSGSKAEAFLFDAARITDSAGKQYAGVDIPTIKRPPTSVIEPGRTTNGEWSVEVPKSATGLVMLLDFMSTGADKVEIALGQ